MWALIILKFNALTQWLAVRQADVQGASLRLDVRQVEIVVVIPHQWYRFQQGARIALVSKQRTEIHHLMVYASLAYMIIFS